MRHTAQLVEMAAIQRHDQVEIREVRRRNFARPVSRDIEAPPDRGLDAAMVGRFTLVKIVKPR